MYYGSRYCVVSQINTQWDKDEILIICFQP